MARYGAHAAALLAYGSRVFGQPRKGSAYDFWLIVKDVEGFHYSNAEFYRTQLNVKSTPEEQIALNRTGPLFYSLVEEGITIKLAVLGEADFARLCRDGWWTVKGRMQKPMFVIRSTAAVDAAILAARREGVACGVNLVPRRFDIDVLAHEIVSLSYRAEIRPELKGAKIRSIVSVAGAELAATYRPEDLRTDVERARARAGTLGALRRSKWSELSLRYIQRNFRSHGSPIRYVAMKVVGEFEKVFKRVFRK